MLWIVGRQGQLAKAMSAFCKKNHIQFMTTSKDEVNVERMQDVFKVVSKYEEKAAIHGIVNCSAFTNVDKAEKFSSEVYSINNKGALHLSSAANVLNVPLVHVSTDYVFDGLIQVPLTEDSTPNPKNVYGKSKLASEETVKKICTSYHIVRTSWLYDEGDKNFVNAIVKRAMDGEPIKVVNDQYGSPTYALDLAEYVWKMVFEKKARGLFNFSSSGCITWYDLAKEICDYLVEKSYIDRYDLAPIKSGVLRQEALRPAYSYLSKSKIRKYGYVVPHWKDSLRKCLDNKLRGGKK